MTSVCSVAEHAVVPAVIAPSLRSLARSSSLVSRNVTVGERRTSVRLEPEMWNGLREVCRREHQSMHDICTMVAQRKPPNSSMTAALRVFIMAYFRAAATEDGHVKAGHGPGGGFLSGNATPLRLVSSFKDMIRR